MTQRAKVDAQTKGNKRFHGNMCIAKYKMDERLTAIAMKAMTKEVKVKKDKPADAGKDKDKENT